LATVGASSLLLAASRLKNVNGYGRFLFTFLHFLVPDSSTFSFTLKGGIVLLSLVFKVDCCGLIFVVDYALVSVVILRRGILHLAIHR
jgi:hypothetical protein